MNKITAVIVLLNATVVFGQTKSEVYKFSKDIMTEIDKDTLSGKYQSGAAALSFSGHYMDILKIWDEVGVIEKGYSKEDSLSFIKSKKENACEYVISKSKEAQITIINEAHHIPQHRTFTKSLLKGLYKNGYRYLGLETLSDTLVNSRKYPTTESGYYIVEPEFGSLVVEAIKVGFKLFAYEASKDKYGKYREIEQAENIARFIKKNPKGKVLIHCGYAHAYENAYKPWERAMAGRLKDMLKTDPLTIDQTMFLEKSDEANNHLFFRLNQSNDPVVLVSHDDRVYNGDTGSEQTDIVVIHPKANFIEGRPDWFIKNKHKHTIPSSKLGTHQTALVFAYRNNEFEDNGVPADIIEISEKSPSKNLYLQSGLYEIVIKDEGYKIINRYNIKVK
ncbi:hypothetical protein [Arcticibacter eurypsychrophilus]|uniref:hypothetical protein n=1 Tax=Arcticibacter eurypsychrophilus TaxID=1434752 RepID=UPI00084DE0E4|nr:hypothetical protein [Arcticibacter eurypsychrophilus]